MAPRIKIVIDVYLSSMFLQQLYGNNALKFKSTTCLAFLAVLRFIPNHVNKECSNYFDSTCLSSCEIFLASPWVILT